MNNLQLIQLYRANLRRSEIKRLMNKYDVCEIFATELYNDIDLMNRSISGSWGLTKKLAQIKLDAFLRQLKQLNKRVI